MAAILMRRHEITGDLVMVSETPRRKKKHKTNIPTYDKSLLVHRVHALYLWFETNCRPQT